MISKKYRLCENECKKVLSRRKPFFSGGIVANILPNTLGYARIGIVLGGKQAPGSVNRNFFRRKFYDISRIFVDTLGLDIVFVMKKGQILDHKNLTLHDTFEKDILHLWKTIAREHIIPKKISLK